MNKYFIERLLKNYKEQGGGGNMSELVQYLIDHNVINPVAIKKYNILEMYPELMEKNNNRKMETVLDIEEATGYRQTTIFTTLKNTTLFSKRSKTNTK